MAMKPDDVLAKIYRDQWSDYVTRFFPLEDELVSTYNNRALHNQIIDQSTKKAADAFDAAQGSYSRSMARYGMSPDAQVRQETDRTFDLGRTLSLAGAKNRTRQALADRDQNMLAGGMTTGGMVKEVNQS